MARLRHILPALAAFAVAVMVVSHSYLPFPSGVAAKNLSFRPDAAKAQDGIIHTGVSFTFDQEGPRGVSSVFTDKPLYRPGEVMRWRALSVDALTHLLQRSRVASFDIKAPDGSIVHRGRMTAGEHATYGDWRVPEEPVGGTYTLTVRSDLKAEATFEVRSFRNPELSINVAYDRDGYRGGDFIDATVTVTRADGSPFAGQVTAVGKFATPRGEAAIAADMSDGVPMIASLVVPHDSLGHGSLFVTATDGGVLESSVSSLPLASGKTLVKFVPEVGPSLVHGVPNTVFFVAQDVVGRPVSLEGSLVGVDAEGVTTAMEPIAVATTYEGMGKVTFTPRLDSSYRLVTQDADEFFALPKVLQDEPLFSVADPLGAAAGSDLHVDVLALPLEGTWQLALYQKEKALVSVPVREGERIALPVPGGTYGVLRVVAYRNEDQFATPEAERLVFAYPPASAGVDVTVVTDKEEYQPGDTVTMTVKTTQGQAATPALLGITVTDDSGVQLTPSELRPPRLPEAALLDDEIWGGVGGTEYLGSGMKEELDLLLGLQDWRRFAYGNLRKFIDNLDEQTVGERLIAASMLRERGMDFGALQAPMMFARQADGGMEKAAATEDALGMVTGTGGCIPPEIEADGPSTPSLSKAELMWELQRSIAQGLGEFRHLGPPASLPAESSRFDWTQTVYWNAMNATDETGTFTTSFTLGHSITSMRIMVDAVADAGGFGVLAAADSLFSVREPLSIDPKLPLHVLVSDHIIAPVSISNRAGSALDVDVSLTDLGEGVSSNRHAANLGGGHHVPANENSRALLEITVLGGEQMDELDGISSSVTVSAAAGPMSDSITRPLTILPLGFPVEKHSAGRLSVTDEATRVVNVPVAEAVRTQLAQSLIEHSSLSVDIKVSVSMLEKLLDAIKRLIRQPSGCFEQTSSRHYPNVMALGVVNSLFAGGEMPAEMRSLANTIKEKVAIGMERLQTFETSDNGFEWFGSSPPHEALTAYGLLEFTDMLETDGISVDAGLLARTKEFLLSARTETGFARNDRAIDSFGRAPEDTTNAYITWALLRSGVPAAKVEAQLDHLLARVLEGSEWDSYVAALLADSLYLAGRPEDAESVISRLRRHFTPNGVADALTSITRSHGVGLAVETTSITMMALLHNEEHRGDVAVLASWLISQCEDGRFGGTQGTVLALKALIGYYKMLDTVSGPCVTDLIVDGKVVDSVKSSATSVSSQFTDISNLLLAGASDIRLATTCSEAVYTATVSYVSDQPDTTLDSFSFSTRLAGDSYHRSEGEAVTIEVEWCNVSDDVTGMLVAVVGIPGGLEVDTKHLDRLVEEGEIAFYELWKHNSEVVLYWRATRAGQCAVTRLPAVATYPGKYTSTPSHLYEYYNDQDQTWVQPIFVDIAPLS